MNASAAVINQMADAYFLMPNVRLLAPVFFYTFAAFCIFAALLLVYDTQRTKNENKRSQQMIRLDVVQLVCQALLLTSTGGILEWLLHRTI